MGSSNRKHENVKRNLYYIENLFALMQQALTSNQNMMDEVRSLLTETINEHEKEKV